jgi:hypothetical protein
MKQQTLYALARWAEAEICVLVPDQPLTANR